MRLWQLSLVLLTLLVGAIQLARLFGEPGERIRASCKQQRYIESFTRELCSEYGGQAVGNRQQP